MNAAVKRLDVICIGRVAVDLYAQQIGARLEDVATFAKYLGGSSGNVAFGTAIQGLKSAMLARVGDEHNGRFLRETLSRAGVDTEYLITDKQRLTALVMLGIKDQETFPLIFYRDNCADMALTPQDINEDYIASARALAVTGTHLSHPDTRAAVLKALEYARRHGLRTALDIDYRPVLWGADVARRRRNALCGIGAGHAPASGSAASVRSGGRHRRGVSHRGRQYRHADRAEKTSATPPAPRWSASAGRWAAWCWKARYRTAGTPSRLQGVRVEVLNVLGAGDAFMSGLLRGWPERRRLGSRPAATPTPAARWWSPATAAPRRCRRAPNSMTTWPAPNWCRARISTRA